MPNKTGVNERATWANQGYVLIDVGFPHSLRYHPDDAKIGSDGNQNVARLQFRALPVAILRRLHANNRVAPEIDVFSRQVTDTYKQGATIGIEPRPVT
ncbi:hypothetical protein D9M68_582720 [compost metagenome]